jgi:hypothetical protein
MHRSESHGPGAAVAVSLKLLAIAAIQEIHNLRLVRQKPSKRVLALCLG